MSTNNDNWKYPNENQQRNNRRNDGNGWQKISFPEGYLKGGYFNDPEEKEELKPEYIVEYPKELAEDFNREGRNNANKRSQIRKYYEYLLRIQKRMESFNNDFSKVEAYLLELVPWVAYAKDRGVVTGIFEQFIDKNVETVKDDKDIMAFVKHFEAVIAFTKKDR